MLALSLPCNAPFILCHILFWIGPGSRPGFRPVSRVFRTPLIHSVLTHTVLFPKLLFAMGDCRWQQIAMGGCRQPALGWKAGVGSMSAKCGLANTERCPSFRGGVPARRLFQREGEGFRVWRPFSLCPILLFFCHHTFYFCASADYAAVFVSFFLALVLSFYI